MGANDGLTQALTVALTGIVMLIFQVFVLGMIVDQFVWLGATLELDSQMGKAMMAQIMVFGAAFYWVIFILGILFVIYPIIFVIKRHRYMDVEPTQFEDTAGQ